MQSKSLRWHALAAREQLAVTNAALFHRILRSSLLLLDCDQAFIPLTLRALVHSRLHSLLIKLKLLQLGSDGPNALPTIGTLAELPAEVFQLIEHLLLLFVELVALFLEGGRPFRGNLVCIACL